MSPPQDSNSLPNPSSNDTSPPTNETFSASSGDAKSNVAHPDMPIKNTDRRTFLKETSAALVAIGAVSSQGEGDTATDENPLFQPEELWKDRMQAPDDGKRYGWFIDTRRCFGCHGCEVSCKSENDVPLGNYIRQTIYKDVGEFPKVARLFVPMSCQHCEDAPCVKACPCGALKKGAGGSVIIDYNTCCGHATCADVCPYGAIYVDPVANQAVKCHNCYHRVEDNMEPACADTCPADAIHFGDLNDENSKVSKAMAAAKENDVELTQLRPEKKTKPRMWFAGKAAVEIEERIPREGESYSNDAYNIYNWKGGDQ